MRTRRSPWLLAAVLVSGAICTWLALGDDTTSPGAAPATGAAVAPAAGEASSDRGARQAVPTGYRAAPGDLFTFAFDLNQDTSATTPDQPGAEPLGLRVAARGLLRVRVVGIDGAGYVLALSLHDVVTEPASALGAASSRPLCARFGDDGTLQGFEAGAAADPALARVLAMVFARSHQFPYRRVPTWDTRLRDETGLCPTRMTWNQSAAGETLSRTKLGIDLDTAGLIQAVAVETSTGSAELSDGWIARSECHERIVLRGPWQVSSVTLHLQVRALTREHGAVDARLDALQWCEWPAAAPDELPAPRPLAALLDDLRRLAGDDGMATSEGLRLFLELAERLRTDPDAARAVADAIVRGELRPPTTPLEQTGLLISALAYAGGRGSAAGVEGLQQIVAVADDDVSGHALRASHLLADAPWSDVAALAQAIRLRLATTVSPTLQNEGWLAVGSLLQHAPDDAVRGQVLADLRARCDRATFLSALGNSRNATLIVRTALPLLATAETDDRLRIVEALRHCAADSDATGALLAAVRTDPSEAVRAEAVRSLASHLPTPAVTDTLVGLVRTDPSEAVRFEALNALQQARPGARTLAVHAALQDASERVRRLADTMSRQA